MAKTIIYIRTSTEEQSPENQLDDCISLNKWGEYELIKDKQSAWKEHIERDNFELIKKRIKLRQIEHLIVWDLDRIYRNRKHLITFFDLCKVYGCKIHSYRQDWLESLNELPAPFDEIMHSLMLQIMGWLAEEESSKKSERVKASIDKRAGVTKSKYGKKWGRKSLSPQKVARITELLLQPNSIRKVAEEVGVSVGSVQKISSKLPKEIAYETAVHQSVDL